MVKLYVEEEGSDKTERALREAERVFTSLVSYAEARSAFARKRRDGVLTEEEHHLVVDALDLDWASYETIAVQENVSRLAGDLADRHALRGFDAIHLASALLSGEEAENLSFVAFDADLAEAAHLYLSVR